MVGAPKTLSDLRRMDAHLGVRCRACGLQRVYDRDLLWRTLVERQQSLVWSQLPGALACRCGSTNLSLSPVGGKPADPMMRGYQRRLVRLAMDVLARAETRAEAETVASIEVSLALHVLRPWVAVERLQDFARYSRHEEQRRRVNGVAGAVASIARELTMMGRLDLP